MSDQDVTSQRALLMTIEQAATLLCVSRSTIYSLMNSGQLPSVKIGTSRRILTEDIERYVGDLTYIA